MKEKEENIDPFEKQSDKAEKRSWGIRHKAYGTDEETETICRVLVMEALKVAWTIWPRRGKVRRKKRKEKRNHESAKVIWQIGEGDKEA